MKRVAEKAAIFLLAVLVSTIAAGYASAEGIDFVAPGVKVVDAYTLKAPNNLYNGFNPVESDGSVNVVIEIPAGTNAKWEVSRQDGSIKWEFKNGKPRIVNYLGYPGNYGSVSRTLLPKELGGDGDPLDIIVVGPALPRGAVVKCRLIGILRLLEDGEQDDKLVAVPLDGPLSDVNDIEALQTKYPGITNILEIWFTSYKGPGSGIEAKGFGNAAAARKVLDATVRAYKDFAIQ
ncbi:MAG: inorganic diphosphatase [bacterium]|nr:inorganic diphosphatase [bacterium]